MRIFSIICLCFITAGSCPAGQEPNQIFTEYPVLFVARDQYIKDHHNTATIFQTGEINTKSFKGGAALKVIDFAKGGKVTTILECPEGIIRDPEVHFSGEKIIFSMRKNIEDDYHIYEINVDGNDLKQLTFGAGVSDIDPLYLPDDSLVFSSTREPKYCMCNRHIMANLFKADANGCNIHQIGKSTLFEGHGCLMPDGRILYDRWEYVDRNFGDAQSLWTVNPDGTNHAVYWGNNTASPGGVIDARQIGDTGNAICIFTSCHDLPWGALAIINRRLGLDGPVAVEKIWPAETIELLGPVGGPVPVVNRKDIYSFDNFLKIEIKYEDPYPLDENFFLCSRMISKKDHNMGIFLVEASGQETLLHREEKSCFDPMPIRQRPRPPIIPSRSNFTDPTGKFYVVDVYNGTHMQGVQRGVVKYLRIIESPEKRFWVDTLWNGQGRESPAMNWHDFNNKRILGTAAVEEDGSAYFEVPAGKFVYFQLLDKDKMMIQSMRSGTIVQPGELTGCVGCHEDRNSAPPSSITKVPAALEKKPAKMDGWYGKPREFSYMVETQPVFDRHCVRCHDFGKKAGEKLNLAADRDNTFNTSYNELWRKKYINAIGAGPADIQQAYSWGASQSNLINKLLSGHHYSKLSKEELERIVTWIDINGPYYPTYACAYPENLSGRSPLSKKQLQRLKKLTGVNFDKLADFRTNLGPQVSFDRPQFSSCLEKFKDPNDPDYKEALAIIEAGSETLKSKPRADMEGFVMSPIDQRRQEKYSELEIKGGEVKND